MGYPTEKRTLGGILEDKASRNRDKTFFNFEDEEFAYGETDRLSNKVANGYMSLGVKKGETVTTLLPNCAASIFQRRGPTGPKSINYVTLLT